MKLMKDCKFRKRRKYIEELAKNIPFGNFCWGCKYKRLAGKYTNYYIGDGKYIKFEARKIKCKVVRTNSKNDIDFSESLKCCDFNIWSKEELEELEKLNEMIHVDTAHGDVDG